MNITQWQEYSPKALSARTSPFKFFMYYVTEIVSEEQDMILLNNISGALGWDKSQVSFNKVDHNFNVSEISPSAVTLWFGLQSAVRLGLIQEERIQQVGGMVFCPRPQDIKRDVGLKRQVWEILKPLKNECSRA